MSLHKPSIVIPSLPRLMAAALLSFIGACGSPTPNDILLELAPDVISSQEGSLHVRTLVAEDASPLANEEVAISVSYVDRNGVERAIEPVTGTTDVNGAFEAVLTGFSWDGSGTVTAEVLRGGMSLATEPVLATATFSVLDRTPPTVTILPPTQDLRVGPGFPLDIEVVVDDEIGVSEVILEADGELDRLRSTYVASGAQNATVSFNFDVPNDARSGPTITLYALAVDLSGNIAAAEPVVLTVDPAIAIAGVDGLDGGILIEGDGSYLANPRALALSPKDGLLYIADNSGNNPCNGGCIRAVDPGSGDPLGGVVSAAFGVIEGIAFDATGDTLYYSDRQDRVYQMTYNAVSSTYENRVACNDIANQDPQDPMHLLVDPARGLLVVDRQDRRVKQLDTCDGTQPNNFNNSSFPDRPWGIAMNAGGELFVSDEGADRIYMIDNGGDNLFFEDRNLDRPQGIEWLENGSSSFADSLLVANNGDGRILSTRGYDSTRTAVYMRNDPVDIEYDGNGTLYILTEPSAGNPGRIFTVTGF
jgi:hypothetical protein